MLFSESPAHAARLSPQSILRSLWKRKLTVAITWVITSLVCVLVIRRLPRTYLAETLILVEARSMPEKLAPTVETDVQDRLSSLARQILSYDRLQQLIEKFDLYRRQRETSPPDEVVATMRKDINIRLEKGWSRERTGAFRVSYEGPDPELVARVANEIGSLFIAENSRTREMQASGTSEFLESQLAKAKEALQLQEQRLTAYKARHSGQLPQQEQTLNGTLARLQMQLQGVQDAMGRLEQNTMLLKNSLASAQNMEAALARLAVASQPQPSRPAPAPQKKSERLKAELELLRARYSPNHPEIRRLRAEIARAEQIEQSEPAPARPEAAASPDDEAAKLLASSRAEALLRERQRVEELKAQISAADSQMSSLKAEQAKILREISDVQGRLQSLPVREQELAAIMRDYEVSKANYQSLLDKKLTANMAADMERRQQTERFTVVDPARVPSRPLKPNRMLLAAIGSGFGFLLGLAVALLREMKEDVFLGEWELPPDLMILGRLPKIGGASSRPAEASLRRAEEPRRPQPAGARVAEGGEA